MYIMKVGNRVKRCEFNEIGILVQMNPHILLLDNFHCYVYVRPTESIEVIENIEHPIRIPPSHVKEAVQKLFDDEIIATGE